jgi:hypothetical protein
VDQTLSDIKDAIAIRTGEVNPLKVGDGHGRGSDRGLG